MTYHVVWDNGTAYDLFVSLRILHIPEPFGLRPKWAAGMRARLTAPSRETLAEAETLLFAKRPTHWVAELPPPKDAATAIAALAAMPPAARLPALVLHGEIPVAVQETLRTVAAHGTWDMPQQRKISNQFRWWTGVSPGEEDAVRMLSLWADAARFGERYLAMLQEYVEVFFAEEEQRLRPYLKAASAQAQAAHNQREWPDFFADILGGMPIDAIPQTVTEIVFAPSYWVTPYAFRLQATETRMIITFRARPPGASLIPGEVVPDMLLAALKALADGTRLRILQQLTASPATPTQLARRLRLRPATIGHHIKQLQLAGLVRVNAREGKEIWYASRHADVELLFANTIQFLTQESK